MFHELVLVVFAAEMKSMFLEHQNSVFQLFSSNYSPLSTFLSNQKLFLEILGLKMLSLISKKL